MLEKIRAFKRKNEIDLIKAEKQSLETIIFDTLAHKYSLSLAQRSQVLKNVVEAWKDHGTALETQKRAEFLEVEESNDISRSITLFNI